MDNSQEPRHSTPDSCTSFEDGIAAAHLIRAVECMHGRARMSLLRDVFLLAYHCGFKGTIEEAKRLFESLPQFHVEERTPIEECRISRVEETECPCNSM